MSEIAAGQLLSALVESKEKARGKNNVVCSKFGQCPIKN
jgi:hypothetical protein